MLTPINYEWRDCCFTPFQLMRFAPCFNSHKKSDFGLCRNSVSVAQTFYGKQASPNPHVMPRITQVSAEGTCAKNNTATGL